MQCSYCNEPISDGVWNFSEDVYKMSLCRKHQFWFQKTLQSNRTTRETLYLFLRLKQNNLNPILEFWDGFKTVDIAIPHANIHIEVDGRQHNTDHLVALADLQRTFFSLKNGITTIRIPNSLVHEGLEDCVDCLTQIINIPKNNTTANRDIVSNSYRAL